MSYLQRQTLTLVLNKFKTNAEGWRSGRLARAIMTQYSRYASAKATTWAYWERIKSVWKRLWVPESSHVTGMWNSCTLIVFSIRASILFIVALSRFHSHVTGMCNSCKLIVLLIGASILFIAHAIIALPLRLWRSWFFSRWYSDACNCFTIHSCYDSTSAWPFPPRYIVLVWAPTRCACFKHT